MLQQIKQCFCSKKTITKKNNNITLIDFFSFPIFQTFKGLTKDEKPRKSKSKSNLFNLSSEDRRRHIQSLNSEATSKYRQKKNSEKEALELEYQQQLKKNELLTNRRDKLLLLRTALMNSSN